MYLEELFGVKGKVAVVTGGSRGIGQVVAQGLAMAGAEVVILSRSPADDTLRKMSESGGKGYFIKTDCYFPGECDRGLQADHGEIRLCGYCI